MSTRLGRALSEERIQQWLEDTSSYPVDGVVWAIESWSRNSKLLPTLADLLQLLRGWYSDNVGEECSCDHPHRSGYGIEDIKWLMKKRGLHEKRWSIAQWEELFAELDAKREGGAPSWRKEPGGNNFLRT
jgi:hypothetical protein